MIDRQQRGPICFTRSNAAIDRSVKVDWPYRTMEEPPRLMLGHGQLAMEVDSIIQHHDLLRPISGIQSERQWLISFLAAHQLDDARTHRIGVAQRRTVLIRLGLALFLSIQHRRTPASTGILDLLCPRLLVLPRRQRAGPAHCSTTMELANWMMIDLISGTLR